MFTRFLSAQTDGRKQESEARANNYIEHLKIIGSATVLHKADEDRRAQKVRRQGSVQ